jgi:hypothetical protein
MVSLQFKHCCKIMQTRAAADVRDSMSWNKVGRLSGRIGRQLARGSADDVTRRRQIVAPIQAGKAWIMDLIGSGSWDSLFAAPESVGQRSSRGPYETR